MGSWNDFLWPLIVLADDRRYTLPLALANLVGEHVQDTELVMAGAVLTVAPVVLLFLVLQRLPRHRRRDGRRDQGVITCFRMRPAGARPTSPGQRPG